MGSLDAPVEDEPPELTSEVNAATSHFNSAKQRLKNVVQARGFDQKGNPKAKAMPKRSNSGAARKPGESLEDVEANEVLSLRRVRTLGW